MFENKRKPPEAISLLSEDERSETPDLKTDVKPYETKNFLGIIGAYLIENESTTPDLPPDFHYQLPGNPEALDIKITQQTEQAKTAKSQWCKIFTFDDECGLSLLVGLICCPVMLPMLCYVYRQDSNSAQQRQSELSAYEDELNPLLDLAQRSQPF